MVRSEGPRVAVIGAGPVGLEAALYAARLGLPVAVYERGETGEHLRRWGHVRMFSPFGWNSTPLGLAALREENPQAELPGPADVVTGRDYRDAYLVPLSQSPPLRGRVHAGTEVLYVGHSGRLRDDPPEEGRRAPRPFRLLLRDAAGKERVEEADVVLDCSGTYSNPRWLGHGGIPAVGEIAARPSIAYGLEDVRGERRKHYAGRCVLVVGGGYSAATAVCELADVAAESDATWVVWLARGARTQPLPRLPNDPLRERDRLAARANALAARGEGNVEFHPQSWVEAVESHGPDRGFRVEARCAGRPMSWEVERVIAHVGYRADFAFAQELRFGERAPGEVQTREPGYYVLGVKSYDRDSRFLLRDGFAQVREVFARVTGKPGLDLYRKAA